MQVSEARSEGLLRVFSVVIPAADLQAQLKAKIDEVQPKVRINGFRPGKVPPAHIRKIYGPGIMQDIINEQVQKSTEGALEKAKVRPASEPQLDLKSDMQQVHAGQADLAFELTIEVMPEFEPIDPSTLSLSRPTAPVSETQVDEALENIVKANRVYETKDGVAADGDQLVIDFVGKIDGEVFQGGSAEKAPLTLGSSQFIPGFEEQLAGAKAGDERQLNVTFPAEYAAEQFAGKSATFDVKVHEVKAAKEAKPDDEFAKQMGFEKIEEIRDAIRQRIEADHTQQSRSKAKRVLFDLLDEAHSFDLPPKMVENEFQQIWRQIERDRDAGQLEPEEAAKPEDELRADYRRIAERRVRLGLVLASIGEKNKVNVDDKEVAAAIQQQARQFPGQERQVFEMYQKNPNLLAGIRAPIYEEKVVDFILELAKVKNETVTREELFAEDSPLESAPAEEKKAKASKKKASAPDEAEGA